MSAGVLASTAAAALAFSAGAAQHTAAAPLTPAQIEFRIRTACELELDALQALPRGQVGAAEGAIDRALDWLGPARAVAQATPGLGSAGGRLKAAVSADEAVIELLPSRAKRGLATGKLEIAILRQDQALATLTPRTTPPQPPADPAPPPAAPPPQKVPDGLLAGLAQVDRDIDTAIGRLGKPKDVYDVGGDRALFSAYRRLHDLARQYLPLDETLLDARERLGWAGDWAAGARYGTVAGAGESLRVAGSELRAAEADFIVAAGAVAGYPSVNAAATSLAPAAHSLAAQADALADQASSRGLPAGRDLTRLQESADALRNGEEQFETLLAAEYGLPRLFVLRSLGQALIFLYDAGAARSVPERVDLIAARTGKKQLETLLATAR